MQNLLPSVPDKLEETRKRVERISNWRPDDADPERAVIDRKLYSEFTVDKIEVIKYRQARLPKPEPNYVSPQELLSLDVSPLNAAVRNEEVEESTINMEGMVVDSGIPVLVKPKKKKVSTKFDHFLYTKFYSKMPVITDLYVQKLRTMKVLALQPFGELLRLIEGDPKFAQFVEYNGVHCLCSPLQRSTVAMTTRREIKDYYFNKYERIGLEVEMVDGKLTCTRVIPGTQAYAHELNLYSAEIVGVNGERVVNLEEFQRAMQRARQEKFFLGELPDDNADTPIVLTVAAFKGGKSKIDDVYLHSFAQRERMKSLFSNIFGSSSGGNRGAHDDDTSVNSNDLESRDASFSVPDGDQSVASSVYEEAAEAARKAVAEAEAKDAASVASQQQASRTGGGGGGISHGGHNSSSGSLKGNSVGGSGVGGGLDAMGSGRNSVRSLTGSSQARRRRRVVDQGDDDEDEDDGVDYKGNGRGNDGDEDDDNDDNEDDDLRSHHSHHSRQPFHSSRHHHQHDADDKDADDKSIVSQLSGESKSIASSHHHHHHHQQHHQQHTADSKGHPHDHHDHHHQAKTTGNDSDSHEEEAQPRLPPQSHMHVQAVNILHEMHVNYDGDGGDDDDSERGGMRAGRKTVARDTTAPPVVKEPTPPPTPPPPEPQPQPPAEEEERRPPPKKRDRLLEKPPRILPFTSLVCVPPALKGSIDWGLPENYIQFTNFTSHNSWKMEIYWVDSEGAMVLRHELKSGHTHMDMCTADHVWAIIARPHYDTSIKPMSRGGFGGGGGLSGGVSSSTTLQQSSSMLVNDKSMGTLNDGNSSAAADHDGHPGGGGPEKIDAKQPLVLILRPCSMALQEGKCLSMIWTPWQSLSISHIVHAQTTKSRPRHGHGHGHGHHAHAPTAAEQHQASNATASHRDLPRIQPVMHIQLFETPTQRLRTVAGQYNIVSAQDPHMALVVAGAVEGAEGSPQLHHSHSHSHSHSDSVDHHSPMNADAVSVASQQSGQQSLRSHHSTTQQPSTYSTIQKPVEKTVQDFKAAIQAANSRYQSHRGDFDPAAIAAAKIQRKPLVTTGALHRMRKDHK